MDNNNIKTQEEINDLKLNWKADPCWDIEDTEGFEAHKQELYIYRLETEVKWTQNRLNELEKFRNTLIGFIK